MRIPFSIDSFLATFARYNDAVWPAQVVLAALAVILLAVALRGGSNAARWIAGGLSGLWLWMALAYHLAFFRAINPAATLFALLFIVEAALLIWYGTVRSAFHYAGGALGAGGVAGSMLIAYALVVYPVLGWAVGHVYPEQPTFGLPCPTTIFTLGMFLLADRPVPWSIAVVPLLWSVVGLSAATQLHMMEDFGLAAAALTYVAVRIATRATPTLIGRL